MVHDLIALGTVASSRDGAYFIVRVSVVMGEAKPTSDNEQATVG
jgi:hypothetical protein